MTQPVCDAPLIRRLLPPLQALSLVCLLFATLGALADSGPWSSAGPMVAVLYGSAIPVVASLWVARSRVGTARGRAVLTVLVAIVLIPVAVFGSVGFTIPVLLTAVALMVVDVGRATGLLTTLAVGAAVVILHVSSGNGLLVGLVNSLPVVVLLGVGIALGSALNAYEQAHARDRRTIAERDQALAQLEEAITQLRHTAEIEKELLLADERTRSARDLHDGLGHRLTLISMSLEFAQRSREIDPDAAWSEVATAETTAREALSEMRTWVRALSPVRDRDATGAAAFEAIAESFRGTGLEVVVDSGEHELELTPDASLLLYRAVQEGLTNALRHGHADHVRITLGIEGAEVVLRMVNDLDRSGLEHIPVREASFGFGLRGLADRAAALEGGVSAARRGDHFELRVRLDARRCLGSELGSASTDDPVPAAPAAAGPRRSVREVTP